MPNTPTACLVTAGGEVFFGHGFGATGEVVAELAFNTAMSAYQEIISDPSSAGRVVTFTFPHIGDTGTNPEDDQSEAGGASGIVVRWAPGVPSNYRSTETLSTWMARRGCVGLGGVDTRRLTRAIRAHGVPHVVLAHDPEGRFDTNAMRKRAAEWAGLTGLDLAVEAGCDKAHPWNEGVWTWPDGFAAVPAPAHGAPLRVAAIDYGAKRDILRSIAQTGAEITLFPPTASADEIIASGPDGVFLSSGPGDPEATGAHAVPVITALLDCELPVFAVGLGHQLLARALGAATIRMHHGHHGANHPVRDQRSGQVAVATMNHDYTVDAATLPAGVRETHVSLFDGSNCGIEVEGKPVFSLQHHPVTIPGLQGSEAPFERFAEHMQAARRGA